MIDRRVQKTLHSLHAALIALILEKGYDALTVGDIIERANIGRSTFYAHYANKDQLLQGGLDALGKELAQMRREARLKNPSQFMPFDFSLAFFVHADGYKEVYRAMVGRHAGAVVMSRLRLVLSNLVREDATVLAQTTQFKNVPQGVLVGYVVGAIMSVLAWWVDEANSYSPDEVDALFRQLALGSAEAGLRSGFDLTP